MLVVGLNDGGVLGAIQAAEQLGRDQEIIGWGQDGSFITGPDVDPHLAGEGFRRAPARRGRAVTLDFHILVRAHR